MQEKKKMSSEVNAAESIFNKQHPLPTRRHAPPYLLHCTALLMVNAASYIYLYSMLYANVAAAAMMNTSLSGEHSPAFTHSAMAFDVHISIVAVIV